MGHELKSERLVLRAFGPADADALVEALRDPVIARNTSRIPYPYRMAQAGEFIAYAARAVETGPGYPFAVEENGRLVGAAGIDEKAGGAVELGYWIAAPERGRGLAQEAGRRACQFAFEELGVAAIAAGRFIDNPASGRVLAAIGFRATGRIKYQWSRGRQAEAPCLRYRMTRADFERAAP